MGKSPGFLRSTFTTKISTWTCIPRFTSAGHWIGEGWGRRKSSESFPVWISISSVHGKDDMIAYYFAIFTDIAERKNAEKQIYRLAYYDTLTGLPNRAMLYTLLKQALTEANRNQLHGASCLSAWTDSSRSTIRLGHDAGDLLLKEVAQ